MNLQRILLTLSVAFSLATGQLMAEQQQDQKKVKPAIVAVFSLNKSFPEAPIGDELDLLFGSTGQESFYQLLTRLKKARDDQQVKAIVLLGNSVGLGQAQVEEVRALLDEIKASGKKIYAHTESMSMRSYALLSGVSRLSVVPNGDLWLTGVYLESLHVRGLLDKLEIYPDFLTCGAYKSAAELYTRRTPSPEAQEMYNWLVDGMYQSYIEMIAQGRNVDEKTVTSWIDEGLYSPDKAKTQNIIDEVEYRADLVKLLKSEYGDDARITRRYAKKKRDELDLSSPFGILKFYTDLLAGPRRTKSTKDAVAIVYVEGPILAGSPSPQAFPFSSGATAYSTPIRKALDKAAADDSIKAVVLRVNSPGGSAVGSEVILEATKRVKAKKPLVVSMGDIAGSGGYFVSCGSDTIYADPVTLTGSIGVVAGKLATKNMWNKFGIHWNGYQRGENAGLLYSGEPFTGEQRQAMQAWMDEIYDSFKNHVLAVRSDRLQKDIEQMAGGRVYTGRQAHKLGLVDQLGGLDDAIADVAKRAGIEKYEVRVLPRPKGFADLLRESMTGEESDDQTLSLQQRPRSLADLALPQLKGLEPTRVKLIEQSLRYLEILQSESLSLHAPILLTQ